MYLLGLLATIVLFWQFAKPINTTYYRLTVGSLFGILLFGFIPYLNFLALIDSWSPIKIDLIRVLSCVTVAIICCLPITNRINRIGMGVLMITCITVIVISLNYKGVIKDATALAAGLFRGKDTLDRNVSTSELQEFNFEEGGYSISISDRWNKRIHKNSGSPYFVYIENNTILAEFRPKCAGRKQFSVAEKAYILSKNNSESDLDYVSQECFIWQEGYLACLLRTRIQENGKTTVKPKLIS